MKRPTLTTVLNNALLYLILGFLWIILTDRVVLYLVPDSQTITLIQTYKGFAFVVASAVLLYFVGRRDLEALEYTQETLNKERHLMERVMETSPVGIMEVNAEGKITFANYWAEQVLGLSKDKITQLTYNDPAWHITDFDGNPFPEDKLPFNRVMKTGQAVYDARHALEWPDGKRVFLSINAAPILDESGKMEGMVATVEDISKRVESERMLRESESRFRSAFEQAVIGKSLTAIDGRFIEVNRALCEMLGYSEKELTTLRFEDITHPDDRAFSLECAKGLIERKKDVCHFEKRYIHKDGHVVWVVIGAFLYQDMKGTPLYFINDIQDITERKRVDEELRLLHNLLQDISLSEDFSSAMRISIRKICEEAGWAFGEVWIPSQDGSHLDCSSEWYGESEPLRKFRKISEGYTFQPGIGLPGRVWQSKQPEWVKNVTLDSNFPRATFAMDAGLKAAMAIPVLAGDEVVAVLDFFVFESKEEDRRLIGLVSTVAAYLGILFQRKRMEWELQKLSHAVEQSPVSVFITDAEMNIEYVNPRFTEITGYSREEAMGKKPDILTSGTAVISDTEWHGEFLARKKSGEPFWEYATVSPVRNKEGVVTNFIGIHEDITERRRIEDQLRHAQKMEAIGRLVGGIAHDFNNILTAIIGFAGVLRMQMQDDDPLLSHVDQIIESGERGANLTQSLLVFGRKQAIYPSPVNINEIIEKVEKFLSRLIGENIELKVETSKEPLTVLADSLQIEQVLINLATNARDAMPDGGSMTIKTGMELMDTEFIKSHGYGEPREYALISVSDTGTGMDERTREHIFEPFFTTKEVGKGTGLGLSIVYGIVKQHNGYITVYSEAGSGTTVKIHLPLIKGESEKVQAEKLYLDVHGTETVLVAEDDENVRRLSRTLLESFGYHVVEASDGEQALRKYLENKDEIRLLILDMMMPKKNGKEVYDEIRKISPEMKALFMSGYSIDVIQAKGIFETGLDFTPKPIAPTEFLRKVREVLDR